MATRYVNTGSTAGGDGTTNNTSGSTRAFATLREAIDSLPGTLTEPYTIYCEGATADTQNITQTNWDMTTSAANYIHIIGELSPNHPNFSASNTWDTGKYRLVITNADAIYNNIPGHVRIEGLQVELNVTDTGNEYIGLRLSTANNTGHPTDQRFSYCRIRKTGAGSSTTYGFFNSDPTGSGGTCRVFNCLAYDLSYGFSSDGSTWAQTNCIYESCTAVDCTAANYVNAQKNVNCLSQGANGFNATTSSGSSNNASSDGSAVGTNARINQTFTFENAAGDDFRLASGDVGARGFGLVNGSGSGLFDDDALGFTRGGSWDIGAFEFPVLLEQEGFRWGVDDGNEAAHGWEAAQDTDITIADDQARLLRILVNATGDPASTAYTLRAQKNGSGGYTRVGIGATEKITPVIESGDATNSGNNTAQATWAVSHPAAATGDLLIFILGWDDSTDTTSVTAPSGPNGETLTSIVGPVASASTEVRGQAWYTKATGSWSASTITFTPSATEQWTATVIKVPAGEFDATTPIGASNTRASAGTAETNVLSPSLTAGSSDGSGKLVWAGVVDTDPLVTLQSGNTQIANVDRGAVALGVAVRDTAVTNSESVAGGATWSIAGDSWASLTFVVRAPTITNEVYIEASANIAAGGEATTARLTAPSGKNSGTDFVTGRRWDDANGTDETNITTDDYTELEWNTKLAASLSPGDYFDFRVYAGNNALDVYTEDARWTVAGAGGGFPFHPHPMRHLLVR